METVTPQLLLTILAMLCFVCSLIPWPHSGVLVAVGGLLLSIAVLLIAR